MNTIDSKGSYSMIHNYLKKGGDIFEHSENLNKILISYLEYLKTTDIIDDTILRKSGIVYLFLKYLDDNNLVLQSITQETIYDFINEFTKLNLAISYTDRGKFDLRFFLNWLYEKKKINISGLMILPKINWHERTNIKSFYTSDEVSKLLEAIDINTPIGKEHFLIISIISYLGLRISDVVNLKLSNIDFNEGNISIIQHKTKNALVLPLIDEIKYPLLDYLKNVRPQNCDSEYIFITKEKPYRKKESLRHESKIVSHYLSKANIKPDGRKRGFHALRFSLSSILLKENVSLYVISLILGHIDVKNTNGYLDIDVSMLKELALEVPYVN